MLKLKSKLALWLKRTLISCGVLYVGALSLLVIFENNLVYPGKSSAHGDYRPTFRFEDVYFSSADGTKLHGWMIPFFNGEFASERYVLYCHGNAENITSANPGVAKLMGETMKANLFIFDYRGYGKSEGESSEKGIKSDTDAAMNWLCQRFQIQPADVIVEGFSIGGGPAVYVGVNQGAKGMVLQRTFNSLPAVAAEKYPWAPIKWMMTNKFDSASLISNYHGPLLQSHGAADRVVPVKFGKRLHDACPSKDKQFFTRQTMDHYSPVDPEFLKMAAEFADRIYAR